MTALLTPKRRPRRSGPRDGRREEGRQASLFGTPVAPPPPREPAAPSPEAAAPAPVAATAPTASTAARAHRQGPTLDDLVAGAWEGLLAGAPADCPACGAVQAPRPSAGAGIVGGRCGGCGSSLG